MKIHLINFFVLAIFINNYSNSNKIGLKLLKKYLFCETSKGNCIRFKWKNLTEAIKSYKEAINIMN